MKSKTTAILLCFFLGVLGIHRFYLGYWLIGIIQLMSGGGILIWALVDFLRLITGSLGPEGSVWKEEAEKAAEKAAKAAEEDKKRKEERDKKMEWEREITDKIANVSAKEAKEIKEKEEADGNLSIEQRTYLERIVKEKIEEEKITKEQEFKDFDLAYAYESMARAYAASNNKDESIKWLEKAKESGDLIKDDKDKEYFISDLESESWINIK